jgi:hypothetical protein
VADVEHADAAGKVDEGIAIHVGDQRTVSLGRHHRGGPAGALGQRGVPARQQRLPFGARQRRLNIDCTHEIVLPSLR